MSVSKDTALLAKLLVYLARLISGLYYTNEQDRDWALSIVADMNHRVTEAEFDE